MLEIIQQFLVILSYILANNEALVLTAYDPSLGGTNCVEPCGQVATGYWFDVDDYWDGAEGLAACPEEWLGATIVIENFGRLHCLDTGGAIKRWQWDEYYNRPVTHIDIMVYDPFNQVWNYRLIPTDNWHLDW